MNNNKKLHAFSIAEALATMLIISLVIIMSMPIFTRKAPKGTSYHGYWECKIDAQGNAMFESDIEGTGRISNDGKECIFLPPSSAKNFTINVIGAGGGGASSTVEADAAISDGAPYQFYPPFTGSYDVIVIGGGGGGGGKSCNDGRAVSDSGGAGGVAVKKSLTLEKNKLYILEAGVGGSGGPKGDAGEDGQPSNFIYPNKSTITATGGKRGCGRKRGFLHMGPCKCRDDGADYRGGTPLISGSQSGGSSPGWVCTGTRCLTTEIAELMGNSISGGYGRGGYGTSGEDTRGGNGKAGFVKVEFSGMYSGGAGQAGTHVYRYYPKLPSQISARVGFGGAGAVVENSDGQPGQSSAFGSFVVAGGGMDVQPKFAIAPATAGTLSGENGVLSPFGGILRGGGGDKLNAQNDMDVSGGFVTTPAGLYGGGGGGGGSKNKKLCNMDNGYVGCWGKGGRGSSGYVRVEWN